MYKKLSLLLGLLVFSIFFLNKEEKNNCKNKNSELKTNCLPLMLLLQKLEGEAKLSLAYLNDVNKKIALREKSL